MSGYDGGYPGGGAGGGAGRTRATGVAPKPIVPRQDMGPDWPPGAGFTALPPNPAMVVTHHPNVSAHDREGSFPVSPTSSTRGTPPPEAQSAREERRHRQQDHDTREATQQDCDWRSLPSQQRQQELVGSRPPIPEPQAQWRKSYRIEGGPESPRERRHGRGVSWQAAPRPQTSSQSPPNPSYQEVSAALSQGREDREHEMASRLVPSREVSWLGVASADQAPNPSYNEVRAASSQWGNAADQVLPIEDGGPWQGGLGHSQTQHPKYKDVLSVDTFHRQEVPGPQFSQEELPAGRVPEPPAQVYQPPESIAHPPAPVSQDRYTTLPAEATSWHVLPTIPVPPQSSSLPRLDIPPMQDSQPHGSRERLELERARQASWQGKVDASQGSRGEQGEQAHPYFQIQDSRENEIVSVPQTQILCQEQNTTGGQGQEGVGRAPFMHYEDYTFFDPSLSPKDELQTRGIRPADTFSTMPDNEVRQHERQSWDRQREKPALYRKRHCQANGESQPSDIQKFLLPWMPEMLWCLLSVICVIMIAVVLNIYDGHALPTWPLGISLNALVAFLATLCRAAFVIPIMEGMSQLKWNWFARGERRLADFAAFDNAARSPLGWAQLLFTGRGRALGVCASLVLLTSLLSSPFTQLLMRYPTRLVDGYTGAGAATVPRSETYHHPGINVAARGELDNRQKRAIQQGIHYHVNEAFPHLSPTCNSSECRWERFSSLAVCVSVADISDQLTVSDETKALHFGQDFGVDDGMLVRNASLPNGVFLVGGADSYSMNMSSAPTGQGGNFFPGNTSLAFAHDSEFTSGALANFFIIYTKEQQAALSRRNNFGAMEVGLRFCVNTYDVAVTNGMATTTIVDSTTDVAAVEPDDHSAFPVHSTQLHPIRSTSLRSRNDGQSYIVSGEHAVALREYIAAVFTGAYSAKHGAKAARSTAVSDALGTAIYGGGYVRGTTGSGPENEARAVIGNAMQNVATSLTNSIRALGTTQDGVVLIPESYVQVQWPWLAFLAAQVFFVGLFLASIMAQTVIWKVKVLKGSTLATLFAIGAEDKVLLERQNLGIVGDGTEMAQQAGRITGKFSNSDRGWVLSLGRHGAGISS